MIHEQCGSSFAKWLKAGKLESPVSALGPLANTFHPKSFGAKIQNSLDCKVPMRRTLHSKIVTLLFYTACLPILHVFLGTLLVFGILMVKCSNVSMQVSYSRLP